MPISGKRRQFNPADEQNSGLWAEPTRGTSIVASGGGSTRLEARRGAAFAALSALAAPEYR